MDNENNTSSEKLQDNIDTAVKKIIVPVALTVGLLSNSASADMSVNVRNAGADSSQILSGEGFDAGGAPVSLDDVSEDDEDDEEKRSYKGRNLAVASASASAGIIGSVTAAEAGIGEFAGSFAMSLLALCGKFIGIFLILGVLFCGTFKAIYPARKLGEIVTKKNFFRIFAAAVLVFGVIYIADELTEQRNIFLELIKNGVFLAVTLVLWYKIFELKGKFGKVMRDLFWGKKGKMILCGLVGFNVLMSVLHMVYNTFYTANTFTSLLVFYVICVISVFGIYEMCKGRMVEDDELEGVKA